MMTKHLVALLKEGSHKMDDLVTELTKRVLKESEATFRKLHQDDNVMNVSREGILLYDFYFREQQ